MEQPITFITGNVGKLNEVLSILSTKFVVLSRNVDLEEIQGDLVDIARHKCKQAVELVDGPVLVEDSSLNFTALKGLPGPYIKHFYVKLGLDGLYDLVRHQNKTAQAVCIFAYCEGKGHPIHTFEGSVDGNIVSARGDPKFGWDPIFEPLGSSQTYAEMDAEEKNKISHRRIALTKLYNHLKTISKKYKLQ